MNLKIRILFPVIMLGCALVAFFSSTQCFAVIVVGPNGGGTVNNATEDSINDWIDAEGHPDFDYFRSVGDIVGSQGSGIYMGNRGVLTARHVANDANFSGIEFRDSNGDMQSFTMVGDYVEIPNLDAVVFQISATPDVTPVPLALDSPSVGTEVVMIGWGRNRTEGVNDPRADVGDDDEGYHWGNLASSLQRWGTNVTVEHDLAPPGPTFAEQSFTFSDESETYPTRVFFTELDDFRNDPDTNEATVARGDSGGGVFYIENHGGQDVWVVGGLHSIVDFNDGQDSNTSAFGEVAGHTDLTYSRQAIADAIVPEPTSFLILLGGLLLSALPRRRS